MAPNITALVDERNGIVSRTVFVDDDIYRRELGAIFLKSWGFVGHDSEIPAPGDFVTRTLAAAPVIVARNDDNAINVLLNSCRHRGTQVCRADAGNARFFVCPYHGWGYRRDGALVSTTFEDHLPKAFDPAANGLLAAPRVEIFKGLIFASWNPDVVPLKDYLGDFAWYLELMFGRTPRGMEVLAPPQRWRTRANWKIGAVNFCGDNQHVVATHLGPLTIDPLHQVLGGNTDVVDDSFQIAAGQGHAATLTYLAAGLPDDVYAMRPRDLEPHFARALKPEQVKALERLRVMVGSVFPNMSFIETQAGAAGKALVIRLWVPLGATETEVFSWVLAEKEASAIYKADVLRHGLHELGAAGVFEQDDVEMWNSASFASDNPVARRLNFGFQTAVPYAGSPVPDFKWPGTAYQPIDTEVVQLKFLAHWSGLMERDPRQVGHDGDR
jgi:phenylpropionate dioxygenase-like ring-hydroxylating dioxygenase large terminal subunit